MKHISKPVFTNPLENVIAYSPSESGIYYGSPSILMLPDRKLVVAHDLFGPNSPKNRQGRENTTRILVSKDEGITWSIISEVPDAFWSSIFTHKGLIYLFGCSANYGDIVIRKSDSQGKTWTSPKDEDSGLLFRGGEGLNPPNYHSAPVPIVNYNGYLWRAFEDNTMAKQYATKVGFWPRGFQSLVLSAGVNSDLLKTSSWRMTNKLPYDPKTDPIEFDTEKVGWLEGNVLVSPHQEIWNILRVNSESIANKAAVTKVSKNGKTLSFNPNTGFIDFPGGMAKFTIRYDKISAKYWTIINEVYNEKNSWQRNFLVLASSEDLIKWTRNAVLLHIFDNENLIRTEKKIGFQYVDWLFDDEDLIFICRTAFNNAHSFHDANYITFHRLRTFRERFS